MGILVPHLSHTTKERPCFSKSSSDSPVSASQLGHLRVSFFSMASSLLRGLVEIGVFILAPEEGSFKARSAGGHA